MATEMLDLYSRASAWTLVKVEGATTKLDAPTPCDRWDVRDLLNHMLLRTPAASPSERNRGRIVSEVETIQPQKPIRNRSAPETWWT